MVKLNGALIIDFFIRKNQFRPMYSLWEIRNQTQTLTLFVDSIEINSNSVTLYLLIQSVGPCRY